MSDEITNEFLTILKKKKTSKMKDFLGSLDQKEKKSLVPTIRKEHKRLHEYKQIGNSWKIVGSQKERELMLISTLYCCNRKEFQSINGVWLQQEVVRETLNDFVPSWFGDFVNDRAEGQDWVPFQMDYGWMMELQEKGILEPSPTLIARILPSYLLERRGNHPNVEIVRRDDRLLKYPITLEEHIWILFTTESSIHWSDNFYNNKNDKNNWASVLKDFSDQGKIDRNRLIKSVIETANMNFNKQLTGWFYKMLEILKPTKDEILNYQSELLGALNCPHSKPQNISIKLLKSISHDPKFELDGFLDYAPILLNSEIKVTVNQSLMTLDKLCKKHPKKVEEICVACCQALSNSDSKIQLRAAKIIEKYGNESDVIKENVSIYESELFAEPKGLLIEYLSFSEVPLAIEEEAPTMELQTDLLSDENKIVYPENRDDIIFFLSQAFDHNSELDIDLLPHTLVAVTPQIDGDFLDRLEPAFKRAIDLRTGDWRSGIGLLDNMMAAFFIDYCLHLRTLFPEHGLKIQKLYDKKIAEQNDFLRRWSGYRSRLFNFDAWIQGLTSKAYRLHFYKMKEALEYIKDGKRLSMLSTPTHHPAWIKPAALIERIKQHEAGNYALSHEDLQLAIARLQLKDCDQETIDSIAKIQDEEIRRILLFILSKDAKPQGPYDYRSQWWAAAITKSPYSDYEELSEFSYAKRPRSYFNGQFHWKVGVQFYMSDQYDYKTRSFKKVEAKKKMLKFVWEPKSETPTVKESLIKSLFKKAKSSVVDDQNIYRDIHIKVSYYESIDFDVKRLMLLTPNAPEKFLAYLISMTLSDEDFVGEDKKRCLIQGLEQIYSLDYKAAEMTHLIIAASMICSDKTARLLAAENWSNGKQSKDLNSLRIGQFIARHLNQEFAPFKRLTDLIQDSMIKVSNKQDLELMALIEAILVNLNPQNFRGLKKLLEYYFELCISTRQSASDNMKENLIAWSQTKSLKKICDNILSKID